ncbi:hypothetical protein E2I00_018544 [Balaenoptera physalus]|uniref:Uncharacterized protein n=1 Tax=Balaenoptera physalus TaxID=9770 RepID=A0A6A1Q189_BALPH|nr:hypothetical protein E2I00_018544 [Balaenoptera physalus]
MSLKFNPNKIKSCVYLRCLSREIDTTSALATNICPLSLSPKKLGGGITKATSDMKGLRIIVDLPI